MNIFPTLIPDFIFQPLISTHQALSCHLIGRYLPLSAIGLVAIWCYLAIWLVERYPLWAGLVDVISAIYYGSHQIRLPGNERIHTTKLFVRVTLTLWRLVRSTEPLQWTTEWTLMTRGYVSQCSSWAELNGHVDIGCLPPNPTLSYLILFNSNRFIFNFEGILVYMILYKYILIVHGKLTFSGILK